MGQLKLPGPSGWQRWCVFTPSDRVGVGGGADRVCVCWRGGGGGGIEVAGRGGGGVGKPENVGLTGLTIKE